MKATPETIKAARAILKGDTKKVFLIGNSGEVNRVLGIRVHRGVTQVRLGSLWGWVSPSDWWRLEV